MSKHFQGQSVYPCCVGSSLLPHPVVAILPVVGQLGRQGSDVKLELVHGRTLTEGGL